MMGVLMNKEKFAIEIEDDSYTTNDERQGKRFYGVNIDGKNRGMGSPCDTREEAINSIRGYIFDDGFGKKIDTQPSDITLIDKTDLKISVGEIFGQDLKRWF